MLTRYNLGRWNRKGNINLVEKIKPNIGGRKQYTYILNIIN